MLKPSSVHKKKTALLVTLAVLGATVLSSCNLADVRYNVVTGALSFVQAYTIDVFEALLPTADELIGGGDGEE